MDALQNNLEFDQKPLGAPTQILVQHHVATCSDVHV